jgi:TRAP-type C4-dicarboxylate transport system permease small subunit
MKTLYKILMTLGAIGVIINTSILLWQVQVIISLNNSHNWLDLTFDTWFNSL